VNPNYPEAVIWQCIGAIGVNDPTNVLRVPAVRRAFEALFVAEMELEAASENVPRLLAIVKRVRTRVLAKVRRGLSG
jgi:hypothetical protein